MSVAVAPPTTLLDEALPHFDVNEVHSREIAAPPEVVWDALRAVKPLEVRVLAPLMAIRALPALLTRRNFLDLNPSDPVLELFLRAGFIELGSRPGEEFAAGAIGRWWSLTKNKPLPIASPEEFVAFDEPGYAKGAMNFTLEPAGTGTLVRTETARRWNRTGLDPRLPPLLARDLPGQRPDPDQLAECDRAPSTRSSCSAGLTFRSTRRTAPSGSITKVVRSFPK